MTARRVVALTAIFCGLATAFSGFSFAAMGSGGAAVMSGVLGLLLAGLGVAFLPRPIRPPVVGWTPGSGDADSRELPADE